MSWATELSPLQNKTLGLLRRSPDPLVFDEAFVASLRHDVTEAFGEFHERLGDATIFMSKHRITSVLGCEVQHLLADDFTWS
ncbi:MAG: hypothetical protein ACLGHQ_03910, partial [Acidimicrobiia bacterium]